MVLVFILLGIIVLTLTIAFLVLLSTFHIEIRDFEASNMKENNCLKNDMKNNTKENMENNIKDNIEKNNSNGNKDLGYAVILSLYLGNKVKWLWFKLNDERLRKAYTKMQLEKIDIKKLEQDFKLEDLKVIKSLKPKVSYLNLKANLGIESPAITAYLVAILASIISILLPHVAINLSKENYQYVIEPIYQNKNLYKISLNCIIQVKMVHIINVIYHFAKKGRSDLNERTTSNRRSYGYSYE